MLGARELCVGCHGSGYQFLSFRGGPDVDTGFFMDLVVDVVVAEVLVSSSASLRFNLVFSVFSFAISCV